MTPRFLAALAAAGLAGLAAGPAPAQGADAFEARIDAALQASGEERGLVRCAGLFRAIRDITGDDGEAEAMAAELETDMAVFATAVRQSEQGVAMEVAMDTIVPQITDVAELYRGQFRDNWQATGTAIDADIQDSLIYCRQLRDTLTEGLPD